MADGKGFMQGPNGIEDAVIFFVGVILALILILTLLSIFIGPS